MTRIFLFLAYFGSLGLPDIISLSVCVSRILFSNGIHVRLYVLCIAPPCGTVLPAVPELLGVLGFEIYRKP